MTADQQPPTKRGAASTGRDAKEEKHVDEDDDPTTRAYLALMHDGIAASDLLWLPGQSTADDQVNMALSTYIRSQRHRLINRFLRGEVAAGDLVDAKAFRAFPYVLLRSAAWLSYMFRHNVRSNGMRQTVSTSVVYRGMAWRRPEARGALVACVDNVQHRLLVPGTLYYGLCWRFGSTSVNETVAAKFGGGAVFAITLPPGTWFCDIDASGGGMGVEREWLLPPYMVFTVTGVKGTSMRGSRRIEMTVDANLTEHMRRTGTCFEPPEQPTGRDSLLNIATGQWMPRDALRVSIKERQAVFDEWAERRKAEAKVEAEMEAAMVAKAEAAMNREFSTIKE